jgi:hypothetical protein
VKLLCRPIGLARVILPLVGLALWVPREAHADPTYKIQRIFKAGDTAGEVVIPANYALSLGGFSDGGRVIIDAFNPKKPEGEFVLQIADGKATTILRPGGDGPSGTWPQDVFVGNFTANALGATLLDISAHSGAWLGLYRWDPAAGQLTQVVKPGAPASAVWTVTGDGAGLCLNSLEESAVVLKVQDTTGKAGFGIFFLGRDGKWQPILLPGQELPGGGTVHDEALHPVSCNAAGVVAFLARREGEKQYSAFL